ncbi:hypothetical protein C8R44DRAFT_781088 [Mycena epipterygia]|nr:hypothetical protein C8R44DRAFT_781088 [Mycena epipterygia]
MSRQHAHLESSQTRGPHGPPLTGPGAHYRHPQFAPHPYAPPGYASFHSPPPPPDLSDALVQSVTHSMGQILASHLAQSDARMNRFENTLQRLSADVSGARHESRESVVQIAEVLQKSHTIQLAHVKRLENCMGMGADMKDEKTLLNRFDLLSFAVEDLLERIKDPEANVPDGPIQHDMATSPIKRAYADAVVQPKTPSPKPQVASIAVDVIPDSAADGISDSYRSFSTTIAVADDSIPDIHEKELNSPTEHGITSDLFVSRDIPKATFAAASPITRPLVPADWQDQSPSPQRSFTFTPDRSPEGMQRYTTLANQPSPSEGTVASLRQTSFGDRFTGPLISTPCRSTSVHPVSPPISVSPPASPRQATPFYDRCPPDDDLPSPVGRNTTERERIVPFAQESVGAHVSPHFSSAALEGPARSRSATVEVDGAIYPPSPSADTVREELSVLVMMEAQRSDTSPKIASPTPLPLAESIVPSSVTPSPMVGAQLQRTSPPRLTLSIPHRLATPTTAAPPDAAVSPLPSPPPSTPPPQTEPVDFFDVFMSPLSPTTPSESSQGRNSPSPHGRHLFPESPLVKSEGRAPGTTLIPPQARPTRSVLRLKSAGPVVSAATTRIKKRKAKPQEVESDSAPPLKRVRQRSEKQNPLPTVKQEKGKKKKSTPIVWPAMTPEAQTDPEFVGRFIGCEKDNCGRWFHYTCMGIVRGDPRLEGTFYCPPCTAGHPHPPKQQNGTSAEECGRPGCPVQDKFFEPEGVFGRHTKLDNTYGRITRWLVFWKGYQWSDATWEPDAPSEEAVDVFNEQAVAAGLDLDDDSVSCILLPEAEQGGVKNPDV